MEVVFQIRNVVAALIFCTISTAYNDDLLYRVRLSKSDNPEIRNFLKSVLKHQEDFRWIHNAIDSGREVDYDEILPLNGLAYKNKRTIYSNNPYSNGKTNLYGYRMNHEYEKYKRQANLDSENDFPYYDESGLVEGRFNDDLTNSKPYYRRTTPNIDFEDAKPFSADIANDLNESEDIDTNDNLNDESSDTCHLIKKRSLDTSKYANFEEENADSPIRIDPKSQKGVLYVPGRKYGIKETEKRECENDADHDPLPQDMTHLDCNGSLQTPKSEFYCTSSHDVLGLQGDEEAESASANFTCVNKEKRILGSKHLEKRNSKRKSGTKSIKIKIYDDGKLIKKVQQGNDINSLVLTIKNDKQNALEPVGNLLKKSTKFFKHPSDTSNNVIVKTAVTDKDDTLQKIDQIINNDQSILRQNSPIYNTVNDKKTSPLDLEKTKQVIYASDFAEEDNDDNIFNEPVVEKKDYLSGRSQKSTKKLTSAKHSQKKINKATTKLKVRFTTSKTFDNDDRNIHSFDDGLNEGIGDEYEDQSPSISKYNKKILGDFDNSEFAEEDDLLKTKGERSIKLRFKSQPKQDEDSYNSLKVMAAVPSKRKPDRIINQQASEINDKVDEAILENTDNEPKNRLEDMTEPTSAAEQRELGRNNYRSSTHMGAVSTEKMIVIPFRISSNTAGDDDFDDEERKKLKGKKKLFKVKESQDMIHREMRNIATQSSLDVMAHIEQSNKVIDKLKSDLQCAIAEDRDKDKSFGTGTAIPLVESHNNFETINGDLDDNAEENIVNEESDFISDFNNIQNIQLTNSDQDYDYSQINNGNFKSRGLLSMDYEENNHQISEFKHNNVENHINNPDNREKRSLRDVFRMTNDEDYSEDKIDYYPSDKSQKRSNDRNPIPITKKQSKWKMKGKLKKFVKNKAKSKRNDEKDDDINDVDFDNLPDTENKLKTNSELGQIKKKRDNEGNNIKTVNEIHDDRTDFNNDLLQNNILKEEQLRQKRKYNMEGKINLFTNKVDDISKNQNKRYVDYNKHWKEINNHGSKKLDKKYIAKSNEIDTDSSESMPIPIIYNPFSKESHKGQLNQNHNQVSNLEMINRETENDRDEKNPPQNFETEEHCNPNIAIIKQSEAIIIQASTPKPEHANNHEIDNEPDSNDELKSREIDVIDKYSLEDKQSSLIELTTNPNLAEQNELFLNEIIHLVNDYNTNVHKAKTLNRASIPKESTSSDLEYGDENFAHHLHKSKKVHPTSSAPDCKAKQGVNEFSKGFHSKHVEQDFENSFPQVIQEGYVPEETLLENKHSSTKKLIENDEVLPIINNSDTPRRMSRKDINAENPLRFTPDTLDSFETVIEQEQSTCKRLSERYGRRDRHPKLLHGKQKRDINEDLYDELDSLLDPLKLGNKVKPKYKKKIHIEAAEPPHQRRYAERNRHYKHHERQIETTTALDVSFTSSSENTGETEQGSSANSVNIMDLEKADSNTMPAVEANATTVTETTCALPHTTHKHPLPENMKECEENGYHHMHSHHHNWKHYKNEEDEGNEIYDIRHDAKGGTNEHNKLLKQHDELISRNEQNREHMIDHERLKTVLNGHLALNVIENFEKRLKDHSKLNSRFGSGINKKGAQDEVSQIDAFRNEQSKKDIKHAQLMLHQVIVMLNKIVADQVHRRTCLMLAPTLQDFLERLIMAGTYPIHGKSMHVAEGYPLPETNATNNNYAPRPDDKQGDFLFQNNEQSDKPENADYEMRKKICLIKKLLEKYNHMSEDCQIKVEPVKDYLVEHLAMLEKARKEKKLSEVDECTISPNYLKKCGNNTHHIKTKSINRHLDYETFDEADDATESNTKLDQFNEESGPSNKYYELTKYRNNVGSRNSKVNKKAAKWTSSEKYRKLVKAADQFREKRQLEHSIERIFGSKHKPLVKSKNKELQNLNHANFEAPIVYTLE